MKREHIIYILLGAVLLFLIINFLTPKRDMFDIYAYKYDGRMIWPNTIDSTKFDKDRSKVIGPQVIGGVQTYDATYGERWIPVDWDSISTGGATPTTVVAAPPWSFTSFASHNNLPVCDYFPTGASGNIPLKVFGFEADSSTSASNDSVALWFTCPANYQDDSMELYLYWFHLDDDGGVTDSSCWDGSVLAINTASIDSTTSIFDAGTGMDSVETRILYTGPGTHASTDSLLFITNLDPEVCEIDPGDLIRIILWANVSEFELDSNEEVYLIGVLIRWDIADVP
ncbi:MAG: hypothetical protein ACFFDT_25560 [Candidatus Hodarchaeota archaeon]